MEKRSCGDERVAFQISTKQRPDFEHPLAVFVFDEQGRLIDRKEASSGKIELGVTAAMLGHVRVFIAPVDEKTSAKDLKASHLERLGAYEPVLRAGGKLIDRIDIPASIIDFWPFCFCWVRGTVVRSSDNRAICNARVHICEVDRIPLVILKLPDPDIFKLRDDLLDKLRRPWPPIPDPDPEPWQLKTALRFDDPVSSLNPQPLPPKGRGALKARTLETRAL